MNVYLISELTFNQELSTGTRRMTVSEMLAPCWSFILDSRDYLFR